MMFATVFSVDLDATAYAICSGKGRVAGARQTPHVVSKFPLNFLFNQNF
jgi:hypothetical protein